MTVLGPAELKTKWRLEPQLDDATPRNPGRSVLNLYTKSTCRGEQVAAAESEHQLGRTPRDFFKLLTGPLARGIGAYNSKFLFSDEYVLGRRRLADCTQYTPVYPNRAHTRAHFGSSRPCPLQTSAGPRQEGGSYSLFNGRRKHLDCPWKHGKPSQNSRRGPSRHSSTRYAARAFLLAFVRRASRTVRVEPLASGRGSSNRRSPREHSQKRTQVTLFQCHTFMSV